MAIAALLLDRRDLPTPLGAASFVRHRYPFGSVSGL
jgi:hypothetical protein